MRASFVDSAVSSLTNLSSLGAALVVPGNTDLQAGELVTLRLKVSLAEGTATNVRVSLALDAATFSYAGTASGVVGRTGSNVVLSGVTKTISSGTFEFLIGTVTNTADNIVNAGTSTVPLFAFVLKTDARRRR